MYTSLKTGDFRVTIESESCCECGKPSHVLLVEVRENGNGDYEHSICAQCLINKAEKAKRLLNAIEND